MKMSLFVSKECEHVINLQFTFKGKNLQDSGQHGGHNAATDAAGSSVTESVVIKWQAVKIVICVKV